MNNCTLYSMIVYPTLLIDSINYITIVHPVFVVFIQHENKPYCNNPCYSSMFGPGGFGRGGTESHKY